jgi:hypothetical protein
MIRWNRANVEMDMDTLDKTYLRKSHQTITMRRYNTSQQFNVSRSPRLFPKTHLTPKRLCQTRVSFMSSASQDDWIHVKSRDGFSFIVKRSVVFRSGTLRNMLDERRASLHAPPLAPHPHPSPQIISQRL